MNKKIFVVLSVTGMLVTADRVDDARMLINSIKKSDTQAVYDVLDKRTIDFKECGEFDYLDFACCKLTACIEKIEHYGAKQKKWCERVDSDYDQELVNGKITYYKAMSDKWSGLKKQVQYIVQILVYYLGLTQENTELVKDSADDLVQVEAPMASVNTVPEHSSVVQSEKIITI